MRKQLLFLWRDTVVLCRCSRLAFVLYLVLQVVISLGFVFFFTTVFTARASYLEQGSGMRTVQASFSQPPEPGELREAIEQIKTNNIAVPEDVYFEFTLAGGENEKNVLFAYWHPKGYSASGSGITAETIEQKMPVLVVGMLNLDSPFHFPQALTYPNRKIGDLVVLNGKEYQVVGYQPTAGPGAEIPYTMGIEEFPLRQLNITLPMGLSDNEKETFGGIVTALFRNATIKAPPPINQKVLANMVLPLSTSVLVGVSAMVSFLFVFKYVLENSRRSYQIYKLCGGKRGSLLRNLLFQLAVLFTVCFAAGTGLFIIIRQAFANSDFFLGTLLRPSQVALIYLFSILLLIVLMLPYLRRFSKRFAEGGSKG